MQQHVLPHADAKAASLEELVASHIAGFSYDDLPADAVRAAKRSILDTLGVMYAATTTSDDARLLVDWARSNGGAEQCTVVGFGHRLPAAMAAFANGALGHPLDFDDTHEPSICHPTAAVLPAALAAAEVTQGVTGKDLIAAVALSTDLVCRLGVALDVAPPQHGWLTSVTCGYFGAAASAGRILRLTPQELMSAFGIALCQIGGSQEMGRGQSGVRGIRDAFTQQVGLTSALLAKTGLRGPETFLEGIGGFFNQYFDGRCSPSRFADRLGSVFEGVNVSYKAWPCCRLTHTYVGSLVNLMKEHGLKHQDIRDVRVVVNNFSRGNCEPLEQRRTPNNPMFAKYSIPFVLGVAMVKGNIEIEDFEDSHLGEPDVLSAAAKVNYVVDPSLPEGDFSAGDVEVTLLDGRKLHRVEPFAFGNPQNPMNDDDFAHKFLSCMKHAVNAPSAADVEELSMFVSNLERADSIVPIFGRAV